MAMSESDYRASHPDDPDNNKEKKPLFVPNGAGAGYHPASALGWVIIIVVVAILVCLVILFKRGIL